MKHPVSVLFILGVVAGSGGSHAQDMAAMFRGLGENVRLISTVMYDAEISVEFSPDFIKENPRFRAVDKRVDGLKHIEDAAGFRTEVAMGPCPQNLQSTQTTILAYAPGTYATLDHHFTMDTSTNAPSAAEDVLPWGNPLWLPYAFLKGSGSEDYPAFLRLGELLAPAVWASARPLAMPTKSGFRIRHPGNETFDVDVANRDGRWMVTGFRRFFASETKFSHVCEVLETGELEVASARFIFPRKMRLVFALSGYEVASHVASIRSIRVNGPVDAEAFFLDPGAAKSIFDRDHCVQLEIPR